MVSLLFLCVVSAWATTIKICPTGIGAKIPPHESIDGAVTAISERLRPLFKLSSADKLT